MNRAYAFVLLMLLGRALPLRAQLWQQYARPDIGLAAEPHIGGANRFGLWFDQYNSWWEAADDGWGVAKAGLGNGIPTATAPPEWPGSQVPRWDVAPDSVILVQRGRNQLRLPAYQGIQPVQFTAKGAMLEIDRHQRRLYIVPTATTVLLRAWHGRQLLFAHHFRTTEPPLPEVKCLLGGCEVTIRRSGSDVGMRSVSLRAVPEQAFANTMPEDARFRVNRFEMVRIRNGTAVGVPLVVNGPDVDLSTITSLMQVGDQLQIDVQQVLRKNFRGQIEEVPLTQRWIFTLRQEQQRRCLEFAR